MANRLATESSPYLRQHADNPVDWYPWGDEALSKAKAENKPILLSVGYSACHWCHVMAHESFESPETAEIMNDRFINIKVDREERPDIDQIYQNVAQLITSGGGWPLTVFLTPDLKPFFGGTYFPPNDKYGRPGFPRVLVALSEMYRNQPDAIADNAKRLVDAISKLETIPSQAVENQRPTRQGLDQLVSELLKYVDFNHGGFGNAPKFPNSMNLSLLWRYSIAAGNDRAKDAVLTALTKMAAGGIYDQLGGGFARYSVDEYWSVPHFEKMLYDNALLLRLYSEVFLTGTASLEPWQKHLYGTVIRETVEYVFREMTSPEGAFYSSQDADSEGEEGKFFVWDLDDLRAVLTEEQTHAAAAFFGVVSGGNFEHGKTVLYRTDEKAPESETVTQAKRKLFEARQKRVAPGRDDKVLTSWNGLMISGLSWAAEALEAMGERDLALRTSDAANRAFAFISENLKHDENRLFAVYSNASTPKARLNAYLDDYAFLAEAALELARFEEQPKRATELTETARAWIEVILKHFRDDGNAGYFFTSDDHESLISRPKSLHDQAIPSGIAVALKCMAVFAEAYPEDTRFEAECDSQLYKLFPLVVDNPFGFGETACVALLRTLGPTLLSGPLSPDMFIHPHIYRKPGNDGLGKRLLICHNKTCQETVVNEAASVMNATLRF